MHLLIYIYITCIHRHNIIEAERMGDLRIWLFILIHLTVFALYLMYIYIYKYKAGYDWLNNALIQSNIQLITRLSTTYVDLIVQGV